MSGWLKFVGCMLAVGALVGAPGCGSSAPDGPVKAVQTYRLAISPDDAEGVAEELIAEVNRIRAEHELRPLRKSVVLTRIAEDYAEHMIENDYFGHVDPATNEGPLQRALHQSYLCLSVGENLAAGQTSPQDVVADWMASTEGHRENLLSSQWDEAGAAVRVGGEYGTVWVLEFGNRP
jgi:uncharacterized protein YkwD